MERKEKKEEHLTEKAELFSCFLRFTKGEGK